MSEDKKHKKSYGVNIEKKKATPVREHKRSNPKSGGKHTVRRHMRTISKKAVSPVKAIKDTLKGSVSRGEGGSRTVDNRSYTEYVDEDMSEFNQKKFPKDEDVDKLLEHLEKWTGLSPMDWKFDSWKADTTIGTGEMGVYWIYDDAGGEYMMVRDEDHAWRVAQQHAEDQLRMNPERFNTDWLKDFMYVGETDKRLLRSDIIDREMENLSYDNPDMSEDELYEQAEERAEWEMERIENEPFEYFREMGYDESDIIDRFMGIEYEKASENAVAQDGIVHYLPMAEDLEQVPDSDAMYWKVQ